MGTRAEAKTHPKNSWHLTQSCGCAASTAFSWLPEWSVIVLGSCLERVSGGQLPRFPGVRSFVRVCLRSSTREGWLRVSPSQGPESGAASLEQSPSLGANRVRNLVLVCVCSEPSDGRLLRSVSPFTSTSSSQSPCLDQYSLLDSTPTRGEFNGIAQNFVEFAFFPDFISGRTSAWKRSKLNDG